MTDTEPIILSAPTNRSAAACTTRCQQSVSGRCRCSCHGLQHGVSTATDTVALAVQSPALAAITAADPTGQLGAWHSVPTLHALIEAAGLDPDELDTRWSRPVA